MSRKMSVYGIGPLYVGIISVVTFIGVLLHRKGFLEGGVIGPRWPYVIVAIFLIGYGANLWFRARVQSKISEKVDLEELVTDGVYSRVRNPIYSAFMFIMTGILVIQGNVYLFVLPPIYWILMTVMLKYSEEKWLKEKFGEDYEAYCMRVNRCIPWKRK